MFSITSMDKAIFAAGCFWHVEHKFNTTPGVIEAISGYTGGKFKNPSYEDVCTGSTGHAEAVQVTFDSKKISFEKLLDIFWKLHDPTTLDRQGPDIGSQYRSAIFFVSEKQKALAEKSKQEYQKRLQKPIVTEITKASTFYPAEEYHQRYYEKHKVFKCG